MVYSKIRTREVIKQLPKSIAKSDLLKGNQDVYLQVIVTPTNKVRPTEAKFVYGQEPTGYDWYTNDKGQIYFKVNYRYQVWKLFNKDKNYARFTLDKLEPMIYTQINQYEQFALSEYAKKHKESLASQITDRIEDETLYNKLNEQYPTLTHALSNIEVRRSGHNKVFITGILVSELRGVKEEILLKLLAPEYVYQQSIQINRDTGYVVITYYED